MDTPETYRKRVESLRSQLTQERASWSSHWQDLADYLAPWRGRFLASPSSERNSGRKRNSKIITSHGRLAARTLASGMSTGITNATRPWLRLTTFDPDMLEYGPVKEWLGTVEAAMYDTFRKAAIYNTLHVGYGDIGVFGTAAVAIEEDAETIIRASTLPIGSYALSANHRGIVDTCSRHFSMTVRQIAERFGLEAMSTTVRRLWDRSAYEQWVEVCHLIHPNPEHDGQSAYAQHKRYSSCYHEAGGDTRAFLSRSGYDRFPILCPRWEVDGEDVYGHSPGMDALPDVRQLQSMVKKKGRAVEKMIDPPTVAGPDMRNSTVNGVPGGVTFANFRDGRPSVTPLYQIDPRVQELRADIDEVKKDVSRAFFEDLFQMLALSDQRQPITAREVEERHAEKLIMLGPVLGRLDDDLLNPLVDLTFDALLKREAVPPPPDELQGQVLKVEMVNVLAQAQRQMGIGGIESLLGLAGQVALYSPEIVDKIDLDEAVEEYGDKLGVSPRIIRSEEKVAALRQQRAQQQQQAQTLAAVREGAGAAKDLAAAKTDDNSALTALLRGGQGRN